jgi:glycosyltransferase involved in cell wall biosynthesis
MKVLWFINTPGSAKKYLEVNVTGGGWIEGLTDLLKNDVELSIVFYYPKKCVNFEYDNVKYYPIVNGRLIGLLKNKLNIVQYEDDLMNYINIINIVKPDVIHIHGTENPFGCIIGKVDIPIVISIQGIITVYYYKFLSGLDYRYLRIRKIIGKRLIDILLGDSFCKVYTKFKKYGERERNNLLKCKFVIGRTDWDRRVSRVLAPFSRYYHNDEVMRSIFYEQKWEYNELKKVVIHTTNGNSYYKGLEVIAMSLTILSNLGYDVEWRVAGVNDFSDIVEIVKAKLKDKYPIKGLIYLGSLGERDLLNSLLSANLYVMPSHVENSSNALCEAMMLGMPCIATYAGGTSSILKNGEEGVLIQDGDPWSLSGAIIELIQDVEMSMTYGANARKTALKRHDRARIALDIKNIYFEMIQAGYNN